VTVGRGKEIKASQKTTSGGSVDLRIIVETQLKRLGRRMKRLQEGRRRLGNPMRGPRYVVIPLF